MTAASSEAAATPWIEAAWPAPPGVRAFTTLRYGAGRSLSPFDTFNLGNRTAADGDDPAVVERNRAELIERAALPSAPRWLKQVHGTDVLRFDGPVVEDAAAEEHAVKELVADAAATSRPGVVLAILTADCLPVVFAADDGREIAAAHAGWPGLSAGMLEATVAAMRAPPERVLAWIGPCAGPARYEIGVEVRERFLAWGDAAEVAFVATRPGHWLVDLPAIARMRLARVGVHRVYGGDLCTISDSARFFSHRRDGRTGRMASLVWWA
ncbi:MAG: peptidoglycan editing factor PgeF [Lysobacter sp.]|nr:MAG: peptidoglycan editing factor PgeF [Lysobacter sp.]